MELLILLFVFFVAMFFAVWPVQLAAKAVRADRTNFPQCFLALVVASALHFVGSLFPIFGNIAAFLLSAWGFSGILGTSFLGGMGIAVLYAVFATLLGILAAILFGTSLLTAVSF